MAELDAAGAPWDAAAPESSAWRGVVDRLPRAPFGRYEVVSELGRGGMGRVLCVRDQRLRRTVAMKQILEDRLDGERARGRFLEEARVMSQLDHPGIPPVHELGIDRHGPAYFTMRMVTGRELRDVLRRNRNGDPAWSLNRVVSILAYVAEAVAYAHARGLVHRDLKPANIMIGNRGEVYVMDWGPGPRGRR